MQFIFDAFDFIITTIKTVWDFFVGFLENLMLMFKYLGIAANICISAIASMPTWIQAFGTLALTISLLYLTLGRQTGGKKQ